MRSGLYILVIDTIRFRRHPTAYILLLPNSIQGQVLGRLVAARYTGGGGAAGAPALEGIPVPPGRGQRHGCRRRAAVPLGIQGHIGVGGIAGAGSIGRASAVRRRIPVRINAYI